MEACVEEVAERLAERFDVTIVTARMRRDLRKEERWKMEDGREMHIVRLGLGYPFDKWLFPFLAPLAVRRLKPDIVHAVLETFAGAALLGCRWLVPSAKRVLTLQTTNRSFLKCPIIRAAHRVTAISSVLVAAARQCGRDAVLIPNGVDYRAIREACAHYQKVPGRILFVGRLEKMKGVDTLLRAVSDERLAEGTDWSLRIVGSGSLQKKLSAVRSSPSTPLPVEFIGYLPTPDIYREYAEAEIFCALPRSEALGNVFLEAQAAGCAVIGALVGGVPDIVRDGATGILVPSDDSVAATGALVALLDDPVRRAQLASAAVAHAAQYDWSGIAEKYARVYKACLFPRTSSAAQ